MGTGKDRRLSDFKRRQTSLSRQTAKTWTFYRQAKNIGEGYPETVCQLVGQLEILLDNIRQWRIIPL